ncbi:hypothetical protein FQA39_LY01735 [Lamprigera yunnana]|nr:hypothetical protein FQA39_LY01735 [Lamprigera yunnana]
MLLLLTLFMVEKCLVCYGMVVHPPGFGGGIESDPAPGRSPGPPEILVPRLKTLDEVQPTVHNSDIDEGDCKLQGNVMDDPRGAVNFSINHALFKSELIVSNVNYQAKLRAEKCDTKKLLRTTEMRTLRSLPEKSLRDKLTNDEISRICETEDVVRWAQKRRKSWNEHISRMNRVGLVCIARDSKPTGYQIRDGAKSGSQHPKETKPEI